METSKKNLWILTEERPKNEILRNIISKFCIDNHISWFLDNMRIIPILKNWKFSFTYELIWPRFEKINKFFIKTVSWNSSFVDFLVFYQQNEPVEWDIPEYAIEETKTDDSESRNTWVFQRASKFVYINSYFPNTKKIMLYNLQIEQKKTPTDTNVFWTKCFLTLWVEILWKKQDKEQKPFSSVKELIAYKNWMKRAPASNVPILLKKEWNTIYVSWKLFKSDRLAHDPNIWALSLISATLRKLWWKWKIVITQHWLNQSHVNWKNKFIQIANIIWIELEWLNIPRVSKKDEYWHYEKNGEKLWTIFMHLIVENFTRWYSIFENHAGCEKWYFIKSNWEHIPLEKYTDREAYKNWDKDAIYFIPDLILLDVERLEIINIEWKTYENRSKGIEELNNYAPIENNYIKPEYPKHKIIRTVALYWSNEERVVEIEVWFLLNRQWKPILWIKAPALFREAVENVLDFWKS